jgi:hypothetical protein
MPICEEMIVLEHEMAYSLLTDIAQASKETVPLFPRIARAFVDLGRPHESIYWYDCVKIGKAKPHLLRCWKV